MTDTITRMPNGQVYEPTDTDLMLASMLTENTGTHMLDSGGANGRAWQRNQGNTAETFYAADPVTVEIWDDSASITLDLFHWLRERVWYSKHEDAKFQAFAETMPRDGWMNVCAEYVDHLIDLGHEVAGMWGEGNPQWTNTYNAEDALSQTIQYMDINIDGIDYVLLQIHGGCDARGGYTAPRMFETGEDYAMWDNANLYAVTHYPDQEGGGLFELDRVEPKWWDSENAGYSWHEDGGRSHEDGPEWEVVDGKVFYTPWGTEVHFGGR